MKRIFFVWILLLSILGTISGQGTYSRYDVNHDGKEDIEDVTFLVNRLLGIGNESSDSQSYVDLGLTSGTLWATSNVGAENSKDIGLYFAWGETTGYTSDTSDGHSFQWANYELCKGSSSTMTKYCTSSRYGTVDNKTELETADDAATMKWGNDWRIPTQAQWSELSTECTWTWNATNKGYTVSSKKNDNSIFLPVAGCRTYSYIYSSGSGYYWSNSLDSSESSSAGYIYFDSSTHYVTSHSRCYGQPIRAVRSK